MVTKKVSKKKPAKRVESQKVKNSNLRNNISIVLGIFSILISFLIPYAVAITGVLGIVFAYNEKGKVSKRAGTWAFVLNVIGLFLAILFLTISLVAVVLYGSQLGLGVGA